ncbi:MAG: hypothetical protein A3B31_01525 [Candidatus Komeilibacteria bacterium RIFCSPLOWO2_01_FULL_53_11]|uniref:Uncharacterized protein n=1 Tax=Candidatus Komeilibacteria bacterium RIFCSPLOWO2_01_FULL_53_11 TaxID=1798552 RepID=A0A1G2BU65_9BACT|nr:MAG: hypothetical protein A3B31_01525 [Candidatus Komeilibacteria bacterium RIFCSPLOWO2_01_FULL_53_11]
MHIWFQNRFEQKQHDWLEPFRKWIDSAVNMEKIARDSNLFRKKVAAKDVFGSNLRLASRETHGEPQNQWAALCAAHDSIGKISESQILVAGAGIEPTTSGLPAPHQNRFIN